MICEIIAKHFCREDISLIENYAEAVADQTEMWHCHHRNEILEKKIAYELIAEGRYYKVPANDLIFLRESEHRRLHSEEARKKLSKKIAHF